MFRSLCSLALQGTLRKKRSSILVFTVLLLSFAFAIVTLSLTASIGDTNTQYRLTTFGEWYLAILDGKEEDGEWLAQQEWAETVGSACAYGNMSSGVPGTFGTVDETYLQLAHAELLDGRLPQADNEVAVQKQVLDAMGYAQYEVGQKISMMAHADLPGNGGKGTVIWRTYTLCGVFNDYDKLWNLSSVSADTEPVSAVMTEGGAQYLLDEMNRHLETNYPSADAVKATDQFFLCVAQENRKEASTQLSSYLFRTRDVVAGENARSCINDAAYPPQLDTAPPDTLYARLIAAVALVAVLCVYIMSLPAEVHSFSVLRAVGITKGQLLALSTMEALLLVLPAVALGIPLGALLTKLALQTLLYSGSVDIHVVIPRETLQALFLLWLGVILLSRLIVFLVTVRTPLTGRMQMQERSARRATRLRRALALLLMLAFSTTVAYTLLQSASPAFRRTAGQQDADYVLNGAQKGVPTDAVEQIGQVEGIEKVEPYLFQSVPLFGNKKDTVSVSFTGLEERVVDFYMLDARYWDELFAFGDDLEAFERGELVYLCFTDTYFDESFQRYEWPDCPLPNGEVTLRAYTEDGVCAAELTAQPKLWWEPVSSTAMFVVTTPYTVVCSEGFMRRLVDALQPDTTWGIYSAGEAFTYQQLRITANANAAALSSVYAVKEIAVGKYGLPEGSLEDRSEEKQAYIQECTQQLILLYACGGCIAMVTLLLLASALALEAEQERRSFTILRVIGMSLRQMRRKIFGKALWRSALTVVFGWMLYALLAIRQKGTDLPFQEAAEAAWRSYLSFGGDTQQLLTLSAAMLAVLLGVSLFAKRGLKQSTLLK